MLSKTLPRYTHDCRCCVYLGQRRLFDLYHCPPYGTVVARYGDSPWDNKSGWDSVDPDLQEARRRVLNQQTKQPCPSTK